MVAFFLKCFLLISLLLFGVLLGMEQASKNMNTMQGSDETGAFQLTKASEGVEAEILGTSITNEDIEEKQKILENANEFNVLGDLGTKISGVISSMIQTLLTFILTLVTEVLSLFK
ncbi:DUF3679 domain-containing protein [Alkalihalobacillus sp. CinArs1]|uniref:DUF3679 domain-containing protein n=1 Tax=Alkalihalobacillus sp. CinArs1 TaxID=2995314 RepID=UPI0022DD9BE7|nr:DUF3679 domain-containing protein [Alkalihalobacillus sp. CinArs1]